MTIRTATMNDLNAITAVEAECFPAAEAASREEFMSRNFIRSTVKCNGNFLLIGLNSG